MGEMIERLGIEWLPDYPDFRDYTEEHGAIGSISDMRYNCYLTKKGGE